MKRNVNGWKGMKSNAWFYFNHYCLFKICSNNVLFMNAKKINKTLTFTINNFEKFLEEINKEYNGIKNYVEKKSTDESLEDRAEEEKPPKGTRVL